MFRPDEAFLLLHWQNEVVEAKGTIGRRGPAQAIEAAGTFARVERALDLAAGSNTAIIHVVFAANEAGSSTSTALNLRASLTDAFQPGSWGVQVPDRLRRPRDTVVTHDTMSALAGTGLADRLREQQVQRVVLCGVSTLLVVVATAFAAADEGFDVTVVSDCCAAPTPEAQHNALAQLAVISTVGTLDELQQSASP
jgi:biuret amidohydrolase